MRKKCYQISYFIGFNRLNLGFWREIYLKSFFTLTAYIISIIHIQEPVFPHNMAVQPTAFFRQQELWQRKKKKREKEFYNWSALSVLLLVWNQSCLSTRLVAKQGKKAQNGLLFTCSWEEKRCIRINWKQATPTEIWTHLTVSIFHVSNHYATLHLLILWDVPTSK